MALNYSDTEPTGSAPPLPEADAAGPLPSAPEGTGLNAIPLPDLAQAVRNHLHGRALDVPIVVIEATESTNSDLMDPACQIATPLCVRWALTQTGGRGRNGRSWLSAGGSLTFSVRRPFAQTGTALLGLPLVVAVAACEAVEELGIDGVRIKWPNDLLRHGRKLGGVLVEVTGKHAVIGIGLNVKLEPGLADELGQSAADLQRSGQALPARPVVLAAVLNRLLPALDRFEVSGFQAFRAAWTERACWIGQSVRLGADLKGVLLGVDATGAVRLQTPLGEVRGMVGDLSLRAVATPPALQPLGADAAGVPERPLPPADTTA